MASSALKERRARFKRYKEDVDRRGKSFFPYAMFHDTVMSLVVVSVIVALAIIWRWTADDNLKPDGTGDYTGWLGAVYTHKADPGTTNFVPRPDWYFYFLFYLLRIFKWPDSVVLGTVGIPTIALILLLALPFVDTRSERRLSRRPVAVVAAILTVISMGVLTYKGATAKESLGSELAAIAPTWAQKQGFSGDSTAVNGAKLFAESGCLTCHTYLGAGSSNLGAPDLSSIGSTSQSVDFFSQYVSDPSEFGNNVMPKFGEKLTKDQINAIAVFLSKSKGAGGGGGGGTPWGQIIALLALGLAVLLVLSLAATRRATARAGRRARATARAGRAVRVILGITGASGAPYTVRLLRALVAADCEVGVCASSAGIEVIATEVYGDARLPRDEVLARVTEGTGEAVTVYDPSDWRAPYASGSAKVEGYVICPCSMATLGTIASGGMQNLIHRAASVALKEERKLVLMPRETPLSTIHLETMLTAKRAGATILFLAPGFYHGAASVDDLVDFVVGRALDQLGVENALIRRWGE